MKIDQPGRYQTRNGRIVIIDDVKTVDVNVMNQGRPAVVKEVRACGRLLPMSGDERFAETNFWRAEDGGYGPNQGVGHNYDLVSLIVTTSTASR